jgi:hypothetical protein
MPAGLCLKSLKSPTKFWGRTVQSSSEIEFVISSRTRHDKARSDFLIERNAAPDFKRLTIAAG